jgi:NADH:ubiquinone reductase (H+-translocating)
MTNSYIVEVKKDSICMKDNCILNTGTVIWATGTDGSDLSGCLDLDKNDKDRLVTDPYLRTTRYKNVYVIGDALHYVPKGEERPVPQMVENCERAAPVIAHNIFCDIKGGEKKEYAPVFHGVMISIGGRHAVAYIGTAKRKFFLRTFLAMFIKHIVNVMYFFQIAGWNKCYSYVMHEIFQVRNGRSFLGSYFSKSSPNFWKVPLRLLLGFMWLREGINKIPNIFNDFNKIFLFVLPAADGVTSATQDTAQWGTALPVPEFITNIVNWSLKIFIAPIAPYFQAAIVFLEIILGLMLIGGLFSAFASAVTVALCVMIYFSGTAAEIILWYFVAGIATVAGSGSTFGLDYYVLPYLKNKWKKLGFVKKWYLYND